MAHRPSSGHLFLAKHPIRGRLYEEAHLLYVFHCLVIFSSSVVPSHDKLLPAAYFRNVIKHQTIEDLHRVRKLFTIK